MHRNIKILFHLWVSFSFTCSLAQEIKPKGYFLSDSIKIGEPINYTLAVKYPRNMQIIFPDSTYNYYPFEYISKSYSKTQSDSLFSYDSVSYTLTSFEIDSILPLALPVFIITDNDSLAIHADENSIYLKELITTAPDTLQVKSNTEYREVPIGFNYPYILIGLAGVVIVAGGTWLLFGKFFEEKIKIYRLRKAHKRFREDYSTLLQSYRSKNLKNPEEILILWKKYMEGLERMPYTKQTSKEIVKNTENVPLKQSLRSIDRSIYGNIADEDLIHSFNLLSEYSEERFNLKIQEALND